MAQPHKFTVPPPYAGSLLSEAHAIGLQRDEQYVSVKKTKTQTIDSQLKSNKNIRVNRFHSPRMCARCPLYGAWDPERKC